MSLSATLSIFAPPSGLVPSGGEGASGDDGLFAGLIEAGAVETDVSVAVKATTPGRNADPIDAAADLADQRDTAVIPSDGPAPTVPVTQPLVAFPAPPAEAGTAGSPQGQSLRIDTEGFSAPVPSLRPGNGTSEGADVKREAGQRVAPLPAASNTIETVSSPVPAKPVAGVSPEGELPAASPPANDRFGTRPAKGAAGPLPSIGLSGDAGARAKDQAPTLAPSAKPDGHTDRRIESPAALTLPLAGSEPVDAGKQGAATLVAADVTGHASGRDARHAREGIQLRPISADRPQTAAGDLAVATDDATPEGAIDPAIVRAGRGSNAPVSVAPPPLAPALRNTLQTDGNAAVASPGAAAPDEAPEPGRVTGPAIDMRVATAVTPDVARPLAETVPLAVAHPSTAPDTVSLEARVESPPETLPATPAAITASGLSRASIETTAILAAQIARRLEGRSTRFDMALTPDGLGRVDVRVEIDADGQLAARLAFDNPAAATELRGRADELRRQLEDAGFTLSRDALDFSEREPSSGGQGAFERQQRRAAYAHRLSPEPDLGSVPAAWSPHPGTPRGVDVKV